MWQYMGHEQEDPHKTTRVQYPPEWSLKEVKFKFLAAHLKCKMSGWYHFNLVNANFLEHTFSTHPTSKNVNNIVINIVI